MAKVRDRVSWLQTPPDSPTVGLEASSLAGMPGRSAAYSRLPTWPRRCRSRAWRAPPAEASRTQASPVADVDHSAHSVLVSGRLDTGRWAGPAYLLVERKAERIRRVVRSREAPGSLAGREARLELDRPIDEVIGSVAFEELIDLVTTAEEARIEANDPGRRRCSATSGAGSSRRSGAPSRRWGRSWHFIGCEGVRRSTVANEVTLQPLRTS
jgi:hypothetical protein